MVQLLDGFSNSLGTQPRGGRVVNQIPVDILEDPALNEAIKIVTSLNSPTKDVASSKLQL